MLHCGDVLRVMSSFGFLPNVELSVETKKVQYCGLFGVSLWHFPIKSILVPGCNTTKCWKVKVVLTHASQILNIKKKTMNVAIRERYAWIILIIFQHKATTTWGWCYIFTSCKLGNKKSPCKIDFSDSLATDSWFGFFPGDGSWEWWNLEDHCLFVIRIEGMCALSWLFSPYSAHSFCNKHASEYHQLSTNGKESDIVAGDRAGIKETRAPSHCIHFFLEECLLGLSVFLSEGQSMWGWWGCHGCWRSNLCCMQDRSCVEW